MAKTLKLGTLERTFGLNRASIDEKARTVRIQFSSEEPVKRWFGTEILDHSPDSVDLSRMKAGASVLMEHDEMCRLGITESAEIAADKTGQAVVRFSKSARGEEAFQEVLEGTLRWVSVGYQIDRVLEDVETETYRAVRWTPLEVSFVAIPADPSARVLRSGSNQEREIEISETNTKKMNPPVETPPVIDPAKVAAEQKRTREEGETAERNRIKEIFAIGKQFRKTEESSKAIDDGITVEAFRKQVLESLGNKVEEPETQTRAGANISIGEAFVTSKAFKDFSERKGQRRSAVVENLSFNTRATPNTVAISGFTNPDYQTSDIKLLGQQRLTIRDLISTGSTGSNSIIYRREVSHTNAATTVAEGAAKPEATFDTEEVTAAVRKIAVYTKVTDELAADFPAFMSYINARLPFMVQQTEEDQILNGDGTGQNLTGILNTSGILTQAAAGSTPADALFKAMTKIRTTIGGFAEPDGFVINPLDWQNFRLTKDGNGQYYAGGPFMGSYGQGGIAVDYIWGKPVVITTAIAQGTALAGAFKLGAMAFDRQGLTLETTNTDQDDFVKNLMTIRAEKRLALAVWFAKYFCTITGLPVVP